MDENPWDTDVLGTHAVTNDNNPSTDSLNGNVWGQLDNDNKSTDDVPREEIIEESNDNHIEEDGTTIVVRSESGNDNQDVTTQQYTENVARDDDEEEEDDDNDDEFGSFEEQEMASPNFQYPVNDTMEILFPDLPEPDNANHGLKYPMETYRKLTSTERQFNQQVQNNYNRMNYWKQTSAMSGKARDIINHWIELEQGFGSDVETGKQQQHNNGGNNNTYALFNWSSKNDNINDGDNQKGKKFENKSHQDQLLKIVLDEISRLIDKAKQQELELQKQKWKNKKSKNLKNKSILSSSISPSLQSESVVSITMNNNSKKKFSIGNFFKFNKKSSISKDHISSSNLQTNNSSQLDIEQLSSSRGTDLVDLVSEFEKARNNKDFSDVDDEDEDDDDNDEMSYQYNNLNEDEIEHIDSIDESEPEIDDDVQSAITDLASPPPPPPSSSLAVKISPVLMSPKSFNNNNNDMTSFVIPSPTKSIHEIISSPVLNTNWERQIDYIVDDDDEEEEEEEEFADFVASPSPPPIMNNNDVNNVQKAHVEKDLLIDL